MAALSSESKQLLNACPACETVIDVTECAPYSKIACPNCNEAMRVRREFGHYEINAKIGEGGMSRVFRATDPSLNRQVALKILLDQFSQDDERIAQFEKEARLTASFSHPNVVKLYSVGHDQGYFFLVMELIEHGSLDELITAEGKTTERQALTWAQETALGLQAAFQNGLIHRDIKPGNILLSRNRSAKLVDFGLALMFERDRDGSDDIWATPYYVPPEKLRRETEDLRSDIYSLGGTLYHLLVGKPPIEVKTGTFEELTRLKAKRMPLQATAPLLSPGTWALVDRMMAYEPNQRHPDYESLLADIDACLDGLTSSGQIAGTGAHERFLAKQRAMRARAQRRWKIAFGVIASIGSAAACLWGLQFLQSTNPSHPPKTSTTNGGFEVEEDSGNQAVSETFLEGRSALLAGNYNLAATHFQSVYRAEGVSSSIKGWSTFNNGIAQLMQGNRDGADDAFTLLGLQEEFDQTRLDGFFQQVSGWMRGDDVIPDTVAETVQPGFCQSIALLAYGLKNWELGAFDHASVHFARFQEVDPDTDFDWIKEYRGLIKDHQADLTLLETGFDASAISDVNLIARKRDDMNRVIEQASTPKAKDALTKRFLALKQRETELQSKANAANAAKEDRLGRAELSKLRTVLLAIKPLGPKLEFAEALRQLGRQTQGFESTRGLQAASDHLWMWQTAHDFASNLSGHQGNLRTRQGREVNGEVVSVQSSGLTVKNPRGITTTLAMSDLAPGSLARFARQVLEGTRDSNLYYQRQEQLVLFAHCAGLRQLSTIEAKTLAYENQPFRDRWQRLQSLTHHTSTKP